MFYSIHCLDNPQTPELREKHYEDHRAYLATPSLKIMLAGPLLDDSSMSRIGSLLVVEAQSKEEVLDFHNKDPFAKAGVWENVSILEYMVSTGILKKEIEQKSTI